MSAPSEMDSAIWGTYADSASMCRDECGEVYGLACPEVVCPLIRGLCGPERTQIRRTVVYSPAFVSDWLSVLWSAEDGR